MIYKNALITTNEQQFYGWLEVDEQGLLVQMQPGQTELAGYDCQNQVLMPAFIDAHSHGGYGFSFNHLSQKAAYKNFLVQLKTEGITAFMPASVTAPMQQLHQDLPVIKSYLEKQAAGLPQMLGWYYEGPFISLAKKGAHEADLIQPLNEAFLKALKATLANWPLIITVAAEEPLNQALIQQYSNDFLFSLGHSNASYSEAKTVLANGIKWITHLYNAMSGFSHSKQTGILNALFNKEFRADLMIELIADGIHVAPEVIQFTYKHFPIEQLCLVTDALPAKGLADGLYHLANLAIEKRGPAFYLENSTTLAGSALKYNQLVKSFFQITNCTWNELVLVSSYNVARALKLPDYYGNFVVGKPLKMVLLDSNFNVVQTLI